MLFHQKIGSVSTGDPLILFNNSLNRKTGVILGDGIWRWKLADFEKDRDHLVFNEIVNKMIQFLSVRTDKSAFRISAKDEYRDNESLEIEAELYNESFDPVNDSEAKSACLMRTARSFPSYSVRRGMLIT